MVVVVIVVKREEVCNITISPAKYAQKILDCKLFY
jgi:hypothetical protein